MDSPAQLRVEMLSVGLCARCVHARQVESDRGARFYLCQLSAKDPQFAKYPRLPVLRCPGFEPTKGD